jgi:uncharacterized tellurite resistance protein B-like protein
MRHYPADSPKAAARIIALALLADGAIDPSELATLKRHDTLTGLGLSDADFDSVIHALCEDLLIYSHCTATGHLEMGREALREVLSEVRQPDLRKRLLSTVLDIANADGELAGGEAVLIACAAESWGTDPFDAFGINALPQASAFVPCRMPAPAAARWMSAGTH